ncbi:MAG: Na+:solute symporter [Microscillaceae bacterium]|nr:Na+:solute symporter [Microscillaceae bacterium]MDW8461152.1 sodium:solute symporter family protein [Cytophagales bacterium]
MDLSPIDWLIIIAYLLISLAISLLYTTKASKNLGTFFLGNRSLPWWLAGTSMVATTFAADTPLAVTELVAQNGIAGNWLWWNALAGGMFTTFFFAKLWRRSGVLTDVELIELRYSGKEAAFLRGFRAIYLGIFMNTIIIAWVNVAMVSILQVFFDIPTSQTLFWIAILLLIVVLYTSLSGLLGVVLTDAVQFVLAMLGCIVLAFLVVNSEKIGGIVALKAKLPEGTLSFLPTISSSNSFKNNTLQLSLHFSTFLAYVGMQWWASWYPGAEPGGGGYVAQRMLSTKDEKNALYATLFFQIAHYCIRPWAWIVVGLCAVVLYPEITDKKLGFALAMKEFLPEGLRGLLLVAFLSAYMSTVSTQLNWGASYLVNDFYKRFFQPQATDKQLVSIARVTTLLIACIAIYVTTLIESIAQAWQFIMECGAGLGLVLMIRWYWWRINAWSEITATIAPFVAFALSKFVFKWDFPYSFFFTIIFTTIASIIATFLTKPTEQAHLQKFYDLVQPKGFWKPFEKQPLLSNNAPFLWLAWISATIVAYSFLFGIGYLILQEWTPCLWAIITIIIFGYLLHKAMLKI